MKDRNQLKMGLVTLNTDDTENFPQAQMTYLGKTANVPLVQPYGLTSRPPEGKETLVAIFQVQGQEQNRLGIPFTPRLRKRGLKPGEVVLENMLAKTYMYMKENGDLEIVIAKDLIETVKNITITGVDAVINLNNLTINATQITINSKLTVNGDTDFHGKLSSNNKNISNTHTHVGVMVGPSNTGVVT